ncbi:serine/threonine-protein phosphatase 4 regulatory subunit 2-like [Pollicipes pollicipes]|uniref:serine/threonine-protein phosphatase 4 regulatory subunit 2-like n=1 Tax=Pollicipes pollicipes TaxID=41117 RepID=UPI0018850DAE|nr:serine/threonine-protein phosphatase 4 regulatory subunit 2-like [Pollicipes pollicipes]
MAPITPFEVIQHATSKDGMFILVKFSGFRVPTWVSRERVPLSVIRSYFEKDHDNYASGLIPDDDEDEDRTYLPDPRPAADTDEDEDQDMDEDMDEDEDKGKSKDMDENQDMEEVKDENEGEDQDEAQVVAKNSSRASGEHSVSVEKSPKARKPSLKRNVCPYCDTLHKKFVGCGLLFEVPSGQSYQAL